MLGTLVPPGSPSAGFGRPYDSPATEVVKAGSTEVWEIYNTTADVHPMHFHLVNVQLINRQPFQVQSLGNTVGGVNFTGPATPAEPNETGFKETVMMFPGTVTRIIMRFDLPTSPVHRATEPADRGERICVALPHPRTRGARHDASASRYVEQRMWMWHGASQVAVLLTHALRESGWYCAETSAKSSEAAMVCR